MEWQNDKHCKKTGIAFTAWLPFLTAFYIIYQLYIWCRGYWIIGITSIWNGELKMWSESGVSSVQLESPALLSPGLGHLKRCSEKGRPEELGLGPVRFESQSHCKMDRLHPGPYDKGYSRKRPREHSLDCTDRESPPHAAFKRHFMPLFLNLTDCLVNSSHTGQ